MLSGPRSRGESHNMTETGPAAMAVIVVLGLPFVVGVLVG